MSRSSKWLLAAAFALGTAVRLALAMGTDLYSDETYYWLWSHKLDFGYFDHPPFIAWSIAAFGIRGSALLSGLAAAAGAGALGKQLGTTESGLWAAALFWSTPAAVLGGSFATPDGWLLAFWAWSLWSAVRQKALLTGLFWGLALLAKLPAILLALPLLLAFRQQPQTWLRRFAAASAVAAAVFAPTLWWNLQHRAAGFDFQWAHGTQGNSSWLHPIVYVLGQLAMGGLWLWMGIWLQRKHGASTPAWLWSATALPLLFFGAATFLARGEANWPAAAYVGASVLLATSLPLGRALALAGWSQLAVLALGTLLLLIPLPQTRDWVAIQRLHGGSALASWRLPDGLPAQTFANTYQLASQVAYYSQRPVGVVASARPTQFELWDGDIRFGDAISWVDVRPEIPPEVAACFETRSEAEALWAHSWNGIPLRQVYRWTLSGHREKCPLEFKTIGAFED